MNVNFDKSITKYCGTDWLSQIQTITGNINHIDPSTYHLYIEKIVKCENNINKLFKQIIKIDEVEKTTEFLNTVKTFSEKTSEIDIEHKTFYIKRKLAKRSTRKNPIYEETEEINYTPVDIIKSDWFKLIKNIESEIFHTLEKIFISEEETHIDKTSKTRRNIYNNYTYEKYCEILESHTSYSELYKCFGVKINHPMVFDSFVNIQRFCSIIINILLRPVYNINEKISKSFDKVLHKVFKPEMMRKNGLTKDLVINLLEQFMVAKYRTEITGNNKYFVQMLVENVTEGELSSINGPRFIEIMDTINTDALDQTSKATKFTIKAKELIKKMVEKGDVIDESIITEVQEIMGDSPEKIIEELPEEIADVYKTLNEAFK